MAIGHTVYMCMHTYTLHNTAVKNTSMSALVSMEMRLEFSTESTVITQIRSQCAMYHQVLLHRAFRCKSTIANWAEKWFLAYKSLNLQCFAATTTSGFY